MTTFVSMTYNIWGGHWLAERTPALRWLFEVREPDLLAVQELTPSSRDIIDAALPGHRRVDDPFPGWAVQSNLWWRDDLFAMEEYGAEDVGIRAEHARLFWVRLRPAGSSSSFVYSTAHLTWPGHPQERADDLNPRVGQARQVAAALDRLAGEGPCVFTVDINDYARPLWVLRAAGFADSFAALGRSSPITHPVVPLIGPGRGWSAPEPVAKAIDWQFHRGSLRPRCAEVVEFFHEGVAPSDHKPVVVTYTLPDKEKP
ncbi:endonuclease/exonuclease/phosphatase family protein [Jiangella asiatica]|uniref:Endonuclease n=1 Tax=Jiangella asiatica TaxID=2530372 RepID=A0A4R5DXH6_9ACTN|nr:endonuclease/exonuclease/phosphatase family protein [Jiangella asiatica]TDE16035.1 endonuclease [Jiangella asiatica]